MNDEAISFTTLRRFEAELESKDKQIEYLMEAMHRTKLHLEFVMDVVKHTEKLNKETK